MLALAATLALGLRPAPATAAPVAVVNGINITDAQFQTELMASAGHEVLTALVDAAIIHDAFVKSGLPMLDSEVVKFVEARFGSMDRYREMAKQNGIDPERYLDRAIRPQIMLQKLALKATPITPESLKKYYDNNQAKYGTPEMLSLRQIVVKTKEDSDKVMAALKGGADFATVAKENSVDPNAKEDGGLIPDVALTSIPPQIADPLKNLKEGAYTEPPIETSGVWLIVKLEKRTPAAQKTFDEVKAQVETDLTDEITGQAAIVALRDKLHADAKVYIRDKEFKAIATEIKKPTPPPAPQGGYPGGPQGGYPGGAQGGAEGGAY
jgi:foldase protein PrsA